MDTVAPAPPEPDAPPRGPHVTLWLVRIVVTLHLLAVLCQPILAGLFLTGDVEAIEIHGLVGSIVGLLTIGTIAVAIAYVTGGRGRLWVLPVAVVLFLVEGFQIGIGYARTLQVHIPLGVAIVVTSVLLAIWAWSPSATRPRRSRS
ncbi:MAG: hypothetical protein J0I34_06590 [Pseudonocardia sp.]|nr:hypothetical protein [Pseudonocardia sp.]ODU17615.1 MAG: hypothetical protein ABS80_20300 [Pseudonocardia sp. SCN 72-51]ODV08796.1 MAG: hypothetical protein ABT15_03055 [Pseudonocardia sp. SCN 73-27]